MGLLEIEGGGGGTGPIVQRGPFISAEKNGKTGDQISKGDQFFFRKNFFPPPPPSPTRTIFLKYFVRGDFFEGDQLLHDKSYMARAGSSPPFHHCNILSHSYMYIRPNAAYSIVLHTRDIMHYTLIHHPHTTYLFISWDHINPTSLILSRDHI